jgi:hypothetical protein
VASEEFCDNEEKLTWEVGHVREKQSKMISLCLLLLSLCPSLSLSSLALKRKAINKSRGGKKILKQDSTSLPSFTMEPNF